MTSLFHPRKTSNFTLWAMEVIKAFGHALSKVFMNGPSVWLSRFEKPYRKAWEIMSDDTFRPLHVAAALSIPEIHSYLLESAVLPDSQSKGVRPFDLAIMTLEGFLQLDYMAINKMLIRSRLINPSYYCKVSLARWSDTIDVFIDFRRGRQQCQAFKPLRTGCPSFLSHASWRLISLICRLLSSCYR